MTAPLPVVLPAFTVPRPPTPKGRPRHGKGGNVYTPTETRDAQVIVAQYARQAWGPRKPTTGTVHLHLQFNLGSRGLADGDNYEKLVMDALQGYLYVNDRQVLKMTWEISMGHAVPHTRISAQYREDPTP